MPSTAVPGSCSGRWPSEDPLAPTCVCLKICMSLLVPTGLRRRRHRSEVSTGPSVWCRRLAGLGSGLGTVWGVSALQCLGCGEVWRLLIGLLEARSPGPGLSGDLPSHVWLLGRRADLGWAAREGPLPGSGWFPEGVGAAQPQWPGSLFLLSAGLDSQSGDMDPPVRAEGLGCFKTTSVSSFRKLQA